MSCVTGHMSQDTGHVSCVLIYFNFFFFFQVIDKVVELVSGGSVINGAKPSSFSVRLQTGFLFGIGVRFCGIAEQGEIQLC